MKNIRKPLLVLLLTLMIPVAAMAMNHDGHGGGSMNHDSSASMDHDGGMGGMSMGGDMIMLEDVTVDGIVGAGHLLDVKEKMAQVGMSMTHHLMIGFKDGHGHGVPGGLVAVKVEAPDGSVSSPIKMMAMSGAFGADIALDQKGAYRFIIGTKLADGKPRTFNLQYDNM